MAQVFTSWYKPNILQVTGTDVFGNGDEYRDRLRDLLYRSHGLVSEGTHDFWITYRVPDCPGPENHSREDVGVRPRPMRGIIYMSMPPDGMAASIADNIGTLLQEVGHHWLVPDDIRFRSQAGELSMLGARDLVDRVNSDRRWGDQPAILGRSNNHWSAYFQADGSPMDGVAWVRGTPANGLDRWNQQFGPLRPVALPAEPSLPPGWPVPPTSAPVANAIDSWGAFNDLDLVLMGALPPESAYPAAGNRISWIEPVLTEKLAYHAGVTVALSRFDHIIFGYWMGHRQLAVQRTGQAPLPIARLAETPEISQGICLRVVRRGSRMQFQAAADGGIDVINGSSQGGVHSQGPLRLSPDYFQTVAEIDLPSQPVGVGGLVKSWKPVFAELEYGEMALQDRLGERRLATDHEPPEFDRNAAYDRALSTSQLRRYDMPGPFLLDRASYVQSRDSRLRIGVRFAVNPIVGDPVYVAPGDHWTDRDNAPKALVKVEVGDFTFGARTRVRRSLFGPPAGGDAHGSAVWGLERSAPLRDIAIPDGVRQKWHGDRTLKSAFIIVARDPADITPDHLARVDAVRRFWELVFPMYTRNAWSCATSLPAAPVPAIPVGQRDWKWCSRCEGLYYSANDRRGVCPAGPGGHGADPSWNYVLAHDIALVSGQPDWKWCSRCEGLYYSANDRRGVCPAGPGGHGADASWNYTLVHDATGVHVQNQWLWCGRCDGLYHGADSRRGVCPAGPGGHGSDPSWNYGLMHG